MSVGGAKLVSVGVGFRRFEDKTQNVTLGVDFTAENVGSSRFDQDFFVEVAQDGGVEIRVDVRNVVASKSAFFIYHAVKPALAFLGQPAGTEGKAFFVESDKYEVALYISAPHGPLEKPV